ncbi:hypothetical protein LTR91_020166 [Friedmanniomyces endolithicus]|uniref:Uncharacterized protein n=1 Tax=Friedmanniomyces endolithicus TaxID=329885 RepID=A0AAN6HEH8_9PEZI|nr:hypothetical protein LTR35_011802 [Friedmanniomyces endolithicus]KAK0276652.1 hypothetical protein LTS00_014505 [Friedmanniomyces endolithicus]KAK0919815.1 hypothetical protein LTR57_010440 [Friedmanniomyces endolithicus]KAK0960840.1 hypothetical protein LTR91_020166 [Friedmanniomyces endolithicus]KAK0981208.1 hypothetical protein LTR54_015071 [Friedmanniomyces endolithicus]
MRFQDWDVLLFPQGSHVPLREFRTACYAQQDPDHHHQHPRSRTTTSATATSFTTTTTMAGPGVGPAGGVTTPLLTAFVPGLGAGEGFQVSVHSWSTPAAIAGGGGVGGGSGAVMQWRVKIVVDGAVVACETFGEEAVWPRQMDLSSATDAEGKKLPLSFPRFHRSILTQSHWNACDDMGRIKVQLSAGYEVDLEGRSHFVKTVDHVVFSFQPAPLDILERSGIAWPHANLPVVNNPLQTPEARRISLGGHLPILDDSSSRSTSAYSFVPPTAYPTFDLAAPYPGSGTQSLHNQSMHLRLPSDQLQKIIDALTPPKAAEALSMPPPPVPQQRPTVGSTTPVSNRRGNNSSRYSDISMHASCTSFPSCISEDAEGCLVHQPATIVRGRKEGLAVEPSPTKKPRDFLSTVLDTPLATDQPPPLPPAPSPAESSARKRTRSALKSLTLSSSDGTVPTPVESSAKKRTRSALKSLTLGNGSPPEKRERPARKVGRMLVDDEGGEDKENRMMMDE